MRATIAAILVALCLMCAACSTPTQTPTYPPVHINPVEAAPVQVSPYTVSTTIYIDRPQTYPPMPAGDFYRVEEPDAGSRAHYVVLTNFVAITYATKSTALTKTARNTVLLFEDGTGLVLLGLCGVEPTFGWVYINYSLPPNAPPDEPVAVLIHCIEEIRR